MEGEKMCKNSVRNLAAAAQRTLEFIYKGNDEYNLLPVKLIPFYTGK